MDLDLTISESEDLEEDDLNLDLPLWDLTTSLGKSLSGTSLVSCMNDFV